MLLLMLTASIVGGITFGMLFSHGIMVAFFAAQLTACICVLAVGEGVARLRATALRSPDLDHHADEMVRVLKTVTRRASDTPEFLDESCEDRPPPPRKAG